MELTHYARRKSHAVRIGSVEIGATHPIAVQSMTNTDTHDPVATLEQIRRLEQEGKVFVLRPSENISVGRLEKDVARLQALHQLGVSDATRLWDDLAQYLSM